MAVKRIDLNEGWHFGWRPYGGHQRGPLTAREKASMRWYPAAVPGNLQWDLFTAGVEEHPYFGRNADHYRWCEEVDFWMRRMLPPVSFHPGLRWLLHFEGVDTFATVWIEGVRIGEHQNMFLPWWVDVTHHLRSDRPVELLVRLAAPLQEVAISHRDPCGHPPLQRIRSRKAQMSYGWDIAPRLVTTGLWRPVWLEEVHGGRVLYAGARTTAMTENTVQLEAVATLDWHAPPGPVHVRGTFGPVAVEVCAEVTPGLNDLRIPFEMASPRLWWPRGHGEAYLYDFRLELQDPHHERPLDTREGRFGVCRVEKLEEPRPDGGRGFRLKVNGRDYFAKGLNWTPSDALFGRITAERTRTLVRMASEAHVNMLRVWGGGVYESEAFYEACDGAGILVWQDFMFACSPYPHDPEFLEMVREEASLVIRALRGHVCLALWCGDNENEWLHGQEEGTVIGRRLLPALVEQLDPGRPYVPSSPYAPLGVPPNDERFGDCHLWNHTVRHDDPFYTARHPNFVSEIGRIAFPPPSTIEAFVPPDRRWPPTDAIWLYHASDPNRWGTYRSIAHVMECLRACGYPDPSSLDEAIEVTQKIQADAYRFWIEHFGADPQCWGLLLWNLCDAWPQVSDAILSYDLTPKKAYEAVQEAFGRLRR